MKKYIISESNSVDKFNIVCDKIANKFPTAKMDGAIDVDGSALQVFYTEKGEIIVCDDYELEELYAKCDFDIDKELLSTLN